MSKSSKNQFQIFEYIDENLSITDILDHYNEMSPQGFYPIHYAAYLGRLKLSEILFNQDKKARKSINYARGPEGMNPLHLAISRDNYRISDLLLRLGYKNYTGLAEVCDNGLNYMHIACREKAHKCITLIYKKFFKLINSQTDDGFTPLHFAAYNNDTMMINFLLMRGANKDITDCDGYTPLKIAQEMNNKEAIELLSKEFYPCNFDLKFIISLFANDPIRKISEDLVALKGIDADGNTLLHHALSLKSSIEVIESIIKNGAAVNVWNNANETPLHLAVKNNNIDAIKLLLNNGANPNMHDSNMCTPFSYYCCKSNAQKDIAQAFIGHGADPYVKVLSGGFSRPTLFKIIKSQKNNELLDELLKNEIVKNGINREFDGHTALTYAAGHNEGAIPYLVTHGADINKTLSDGEKVIDKIDKLLKTKK